LTYQILNLPDVMDRVVRELNRNILDRGGHLHARLRAKWPVPRRLFVEFGVAFRLDKLEFRSQLSSRSERAMFVELIKWTKNLTHSSRPSSSVTFFIASLLA
jgi:hypothetical protein